MRSFFATVVARTARTVRRASCRGSIAAANGARHAAIASTPCAEQSPGRVRRRVGSSRHCDVCRATARTKNTKYALKMAFTRSLGRNLNSKNRPTKKQLRCGVVRRPREMAHLRARGAAVAQPATAAGGRTCRSAGTAWRLSAS